VSAAYEVLGDPVKRQQYDRVRLGASGPRGEASPWMEGFGVYFFSATVHGPT